MYTVANLRAFCSRVGVEKAGDENVITLPENRIRPVTDPCGTPFNIMGEKSLMLLKPKHFVRSDIQILEDHFQRTTVHFIRNAHTAAYSPGPLQIYFHLKGSG